MHQLQIIVSLGLGTSLIITSMSVFGVPIVNFKMLITRTNREGTDQT